MTKYIIKNCPALRWDRKHFKICYDRNSQTKCSDISDCIIKQIIKLCNNIKTINKRNSYVGEYIEFTQHNPLAEEILQKLDIEDVEDENNEC